MNKHRLITRTSVFPASEETIWNKLQQASTLREIAYPLAAFTACDGNNDITWHAGDTFQFWFKLFSVIPFGIHTIHVVEFNEVTHEIYTQEANTHVPVWNHRIYLKYRSDDTTEYTDAVEIYAGWKTTLICAWARIFYRHRQKQWINLLHKSAANERPY